MAMPDTIFALASARGRSGVAVIRISGPRSDAALTVLTPMYPLPSPRSMSLRRLSDPSDGSLLDEALVVRFSTDASFTGEASAEIQCHGGPAVVASMLCVLGAIPGLREAEPGEFTRRAFDCGSLDLAQIEGLADLIAAETDAQRRAALRQSEGSLGRMCRSWSDRLTKALALLEATIDFSDEEIPEETYGLVTSNALGVRDEIVALLDGAILSERYRDGWRIALIGAPNAGKSSLINALTKRDVAIISEIAGTTRDPIEVSLDLNGYPVTLIDTAGLRETGDAIEAQGVARAHQSAETADLRIALAAPDAPFTDDVSSRLIPGDLTIWNKSDFGAAPDGYALAVSAKTGNHLDDLIRLITERLDFADPTDGSAVLRRRHESALKEAANEINRFDALANGPDTPLKETPEIAAEYLRISRTALGSITGDVGVESLLDVIFSEFCLGK